jgi:hypothetical protein
LNAVTKVNNDMKLKKMLIFLLVGSFGQRVDRRGQEDRLLDGSPVGADPRRQRNEARADRLRQGSGRRVRTNHGAGEGVGQTLH